MARLTPSLFALAALTLTALAGTTEAGCGGGGGYGGGFHAPSYGGHSYRQPVYRSIAPSYHAPSYQTPSYQAPITSAPAIQPAPSQFIQQPGSPVTPSPSFSTGNPISAAPQQQQLLQSPARQQSVPQQPLQPQTQVQPQQSPLDAALQALGGVAPAPQQQIAQPQAPIAPQHVGSFSARLSNGATVQLTLGQNGSFSWAATNQDGKQSQFSGSYTLSGNSLTLTRGNDNQQLAGTLSSLTGNGFQFQLSNAGSPLSFVRG